MKCLYFVLLVAGSQAFVTREARESRDDKDIPTPTLVRLTALDPPGFEVEWNPVKNSDSSEPIVGYKVKVWERGNNKQYHYETVDGKKVLVEKDAPSKFDSNKIPSGKPKEIIVKGVDKSSAKVENIKVGVAYETRVQAYTKNKDGPLSQPMSLELHQNDEHNKKDTYTVE